MIITCKECEAQYEIPEEFFAKGGRKVKCDNCGNIWVQKSLKDQIYEQLEEASIKSLSDEDDEEEQEKSNEEPEENKKSRAQLLREQQQHPEYNENLDNEMKKVFEDLTSKVQEAVNSEPEKIENIAQPEAPDTIASSMEKIEENIEKIEELIVEDIKEEAEKIAEVIKEEAKEISKEIKNEAKEIAEELKAEAKHFEGVVEKEAEAAEKAAIKCVKELFFNIKNFKPASRTALSFGFMAFISLVFLTTSLLLFFRTFIIAYYPQTMIMYEKVGLGIKAPGEGIKIGNLSANQEKEGDQYNITIKGEIINNTEKDLRFPRLMVLLKDRENKVLSKFLPKPDRKKVEAGKTYPFELRFFDVPEDGTLTEVTVKH